MEAYVQALGSALHVKEEILAALQDKVLEQGRRQALVAETRTAASHNQAKLLIEAESRIAELQRTKSDRRSRAAR